jgi:endoglucanase
MRSWLSRSGCWVLLALLSFAAGSRVQGQAGWPLWNGYASHFIDAQGRVIDHLAGEHSTSEGQSYAMFFALVANDRGRFDKILSWTQVNLVQGGDLGAHLPGWLWGKAPDGQWRLLDGGSSADSDCWIAYDLLEAGRLWNEPRYTQLGRRMLAVIAKQEVADLPGFGVMLMPGLSENFIQDKVYTLNPSYVPTFLFQRFATTQPAGPWNAITANISKFLSQSARRGFAMDWSNYSQEYGFWPAPRCSAGGGTKPGCGSYDAIRVYAWAGMVNSTGGLRGKLLAAVPGMAAYLANHDAPPEKVSDQGIPMAQDGPVGFAAVLLPYLQALPQSGQALVQQQKRVAGELNPVTGLYGNEPTYYDQNLALFGVGFAEKRFGFGPGGELTVGWKH